MPNNYAEADISFYGKEKMNHFDVHLNDYGSFIQWDSVEGSGGYAIYRKEVGKEGWGILVTLDPHVTKFQDSKPPTDSLYEYQLYQITEGDFIIGEEDVAGGVDFSLTVDNESAEQDMSNRIRTQKGDWRSHQNLGADLELLEGEPNTRETGSRGEEQIHEALTYDGRFISQDVSVRAVPTSIEQIDFYTILDTDDNEPVIVKTPQGI
jgi:hypothetical protein